MARANGEGSIYKVRDKSGKITGYRAAYYVHTAKGPKRKYLSGKTRDEVAIKLTKAMADRNGGLVFDAGTVTVEEYLERWLSDSVRDTVRQRTYEGYEHIVERHISPALGVVKLSKLTPAHVRGFYRDKLDAGLSAYRALRAHHAQQGALPDRSGWSDTAQRSGERKASTAAQGGDSASGQGAGPYPA